MGFVKRILFVALLCLAQYGASAQPFAQQQYKIQVLEKGTREALPYASIFYPDDKTGTTTDAQGRFSINTTQRSVFIQISSLGYQTFLGQLDLEQAGGVVYLQPSVHRIQEVIISGSASRLQGENVQNVDRLTLNNPAGAKGVSLADQLTSVPGVDNWSTGVGIGKPVIRGLSGNRVAVYSQGVRVENQQWGDEHGLGLDENGFEDVEIIKGPASLLYGNDALGGVLYFVDERYANDNSIEGALNSEYNSNTDGWRNSGAFKLSKGRFHWNAFGAYTTHRDYEDGNGERVDNSRFHTGDFKTTLGYTGDRVTSSLKYNFLNEQYGLSDTSVIVPANGRAPQLPYQDLTTHLVSSENTVKLGGGSKLKVVVGYIFNNRKEFEDAPVAALNMNLGTWSYDAKWFSPRLGDRWIVTAGSQGTLQTNTNHGQEVLIPDATTSGIGLFVTADDYYTQRSYWQIGARFDGNHIDGSQHGAAGEEGYIPRFVKTYTAFNFSTGIYQQLRDDLSLRLDLASGYRAPNMFELLSNGVHEGTNRYEIGDPGLRTENSYQIDGSLNYRRTHLELFATPFLNYIRNYIYLDPSGDARDGLPVYYYRQTDAYLYGGEAGFHLHPHPLDWLHLDGSYSATFGQEADGSDLPLIPAQRINATVRATFTGKKTIAQFSAFVQNQYTFAQNLVAAYETTTGGYNLVSAGVDLMLNFSGQKLALSLAANNIFNKTYYDHLSRYRTEGIYNIGRNIVAKLSIPLSWKMK